MTDRSPEAAAAVPEPASPASARGAGGLERRGAQVIAALIVTIAVCFNFVGGAVMAYALMVLTLIAVLWSVAWRRPIWGLRLQPARQMLLAAFLLLLLAFTVTARQPADIRYAGNFLMLAAFVPLSGFMASLADPRNLGRVALLGLVGAALSLGVALVQILHFKLGRAAGYGSDPIWSADAALIVGFLSIIGYFAERPPIPRWLFLLGPAMAVLTTWLTGSRGPLIALPFMALLVVIAIGKRVRLAAVVVVIATAVCVISLHRYWPEGAVRFLSFLDTIRELASGGPIKDSSASIRLTFWHIGIEAFLHAPIFGYGWAHFLEAAYAYLPDHGDAFRTTIIRFNIHLHADVLDFGVSAGILGLAAYGLILAAPLLDAWRSPPDSQQAARRVGALLLVTGYFVCGLTYLLFGYEFHTTLYVVLAAIVLGYCRDQPTAEQAAPAKRRA